MPVRSPYKIVIRRTKNKIKFQNGELYSNPAADNDVVEMGAVNAPIPIARYHARYKQLMTDDAYALSMEYEKIALEVPVTHFPITIAKQPPYKHKNRFVDILPYDETRVVLPLEAGDPTSHYINASWISTPHQKNKFIAAQGPKPETLPDFWRMMWENNVHVIVMVTNFMEKGRKKCEEYWSDKQVVVFGPFSIECLGVVPFPDYKVRRLALHHNNLKSRIISHYHYEGWPDHGVPDTPTSMIAFARRAFSDEAKGPIMVHCSAGVGRTGTIITLNAQMENIKNNRSIDIFDTVCKLRSCRKLMVQTESQYVFLYRAVNELLRCGETEVFAQVLGKAYRDLTKDSPEKTGLQLEYQRLVYTGRDERTQQFIEGNREYNTTKNRYHNILPYDRSRVRLLHTTGVPGSDYINASWVPSFHHAQMYIATQAPKEGTTEDFWRMIHEQGCSTIVMMCSVQEEGKVKCAVYWPQVDGEELQFGATKIKLLSSEETSGVVRRELSVTNAHDGYNSVRLVRMWHFRGLSEKSMSITGINFISVIEQVSRWRKQQGHTPVVVHCTGGVGRTGVFIALANTLEQLKLEGTIDIFQNCLQLRRCRPFMVQSLEQYDFLYRALVEYIEHFDNYDNFK